MENIPKLSDERKALAETCIRLAWLEAIRACKRFDLDLHSDGISIAFMGLTKAAAYFDPSRGFRFSTYATHAIRREFIRELRYRTCKCRDPLRVESIERDDGQIDIPARESKSAFGGDDIKQLQEAVAQLQGREAYLIKGAMAGRTLKQMRVKLGISKARAGQIWRLAIGHLRGMMGQKTPRLKLLKAKVA